ncbi:hypothetical protein GCM10020000_23810 [Streptomyces olivoverticillatus]
MAGRLTRKTEPHQKWFSRKPLSTGPSEIPLAMAADQMATAVARCLASRNMLRTSASVEGISVAPPMPSTARQTMSMVGLWA